MLGIRVIYTLVALVTQKPYLSPTSGALAIRVLLGLLPELIVVLVYAVVGFLTRNVKHSKTSRRINVRGQPTDSDQEGKTRW